VFEPVVAYEPVFEVRDAVAKFNAVKLLFTEAVNVFVPAIEAVNVLVAAIEAVNVLVAATDAVKVSTAFNLAL
jgi:hypothetical protein